MATGGEPCEDDSHIRDLLECAICLESLIEKQPRLLHCGHTFCTPCLKKIKRVRDCVNCPRCRENTRLPANGVDGLVQNRDLRQINDIQLQLSFQNKIQCQMCRKQNAQAAFICINCRKKTICKLCYEAHKKVPALKKHEIIELEENKPEEERHGRCQEHKEPLEMLCLLCESALCIMCITDPKHAKHQEQILDFKGGIQQLRQVHEKLRSSLNEAAQNVDTSADIVKEQLKSIKEAKVTLSDQQELLKQTLRKIEMELTNVCDADTNMSELHEDLLKNSNDLRAHISQIDYLSKRSDEDYILKSRESKQICEPLLRQSELILNREIQWCREVQGGLKITGSPCKIKTCKEILKAKISPRNIENFLNRQMKEETGNLQEIKWKKSISKSKKKEIVLKEDFCLKHLTLKADIKPGGDIELVNPCELVNVGDGTVILVNWVLNFVQRIDSNGILQRRYKIDDEHKVEGASVYNGKLYISSAAKTVTRMPLDCEEISDVFNLSFLESPWIRVSVLDEDTLIITEHHFGRIWQYNTKNKKHRQINIASLKAKKGKVCISRSGTDVRFIVKYQDSLSRARVDIFDKTWRLVSQIEDLADPDGLEITPDGTLLIADRGSNRIVAYNIQGSSVEKIHFLGPENDFQLFNPSDIAYHPPYLWVIQRNPNNLKIFKEQT